MTSRFSIVEARFHRETSGFRTRECLELAKPSGLPATLLGSTRNALGPRAIPSRPPAIPSRLPGLPSSSSGDASRPLAAFLGGYLVAYRWKGEASIGIADPCRFPRLAKGLQRISFVELREDLECHRVVKPSVGIREGLIAHSEEGIETGP
jgi:hypothetical protein